MNDIEINVGDKSPLRLLNTAKIYKTLTQSYTSCRIVVICCRELMNILIIELCSNADG